MSESLKSAVRTAVLRLLHPLVKLLLDMGIGVGEFMAMVKVAYVRAAQEKGRESPGGSRRPSVSRIAVVTGLTRVEIAAILASGDGDSRGSDRGRQRAERVLAGWWNDRDFQDERGQPAVLSEKGGRHSFAALCERYSGDPQFPAILDELIRVRAVRRARDGRLVAVSRTYATVRWDPDGVVALGEELADHCATLLQNLKNPNRPRLVRRVINTQLNPYYAPVVIRDLEERAATLADSLDDMINDPLYTVKPADGGPTLRVGIGMYVIEELPEEDSRASEPTQAERTSPERRARKTKGERRP